MSRAVLAPAFPDGLLLAYYGDDFTGSTDAMEAMTAAGVPTVLFLEVPTPAMLERFPQVRCIGLAGSSRGRSPAWMKTELPLAFASLAALGAPILQYKVCSTFDSSPDTGSIGCAVDLGVRHMHGRWSPMVIGAPRLKRYQIFGNLFAAVDGVAYRLDRHPTMSRHPVTPMAESDLRRHLQKQTKRRIELIDTLQLGLGKGDERAHVLAGHDTPVVMIDVHDDETLLAAGRTIWEQRGDGIFSASSSGLQYALAAYWRKLGLLPQQAALPQVDAVPAIAVVSGSCSPVTAKQICWARENGFLTERLDLARALNPAEREGEIKRVVDLASSSIRLGTSAIVYSAAGPDDPSVIHFDAIAAQAGLSRSEAARNIGTTLADTMRQLLDQVELQRIVVAGGDSSGEVASALGIGAISVVAGMAPGAPLCRIWSSHPKRDGLEIVLKGGQIGTETFFGDVLAGKPIAARNPCY